MCSNLIKSTTMGISCDLKKKKNVVRKMMKLTAQFMDLIHLGCETHRIPEKSSDGNLRLTNDHSVRLIPLR